MATPVLLLIDKPIVSYNVLALLSFILSGYGTYLFSFYLTRNRFASIVAGVVFAFFPYRIFQFGHLHVISTQWIPFAFLYLYKFFEYRNYKNMGLFLLFSLLQILSSSSNAIFFVISITIFGLFLFIEGRGYKDGKLIIKILLIVIISFIILLPFYIPYIENQKLMGFKRDKSEIEYYSARIENYLASTSRLYQPLTNKFGKHESYLFLGIFPFILALIGFLKSDSKDRYILKKKFSIITIIDIGLIICFLLIIVTMIGGGINIESLGLKISSRNLLSPWIIFSILILIRRLLNRFQIPFILSGIFKASRIQVSFFVLAMLAVSLSLGIGGVASDKLYNFFYEYIPGFKFIRVPARIGMFVSFFVSLLAAYGVKRLMELKVVRKAVFIVIPIILIEYAAFPIKFYPIEETPEVYKWLKKEKDDFPVIELPIENFWLNIRYVYHSTTHWKKLVNGYSGFFPPSDHLVQKASLDDLITLLDYLDYIGVKYLIVHRDHINPGQLERIKGLKDRLVLKESLEGEDVYEFKYLKQIKKVPTDLTGFKEIEQVRWSAFSNNNSSDLHFAFDGNLETRWHSGKPQRTGSYFMLDLRDAHRISAISIELGNYYKDYPRGLILKTSTDNIHWKEVSIKNDVLLDLLYSSINTPKNIKYIMVFQPVRLRYLQMTLSGSDDTYYWSIPEIRVFSDR